MSNRVLINRQFVGLLILLISATISIDAYAACRNVPLGSNMSLYFPAMAKRMAAVYGIGMKRFVQKGYYAGSPLKLVTYRFGSKKEIEMATSVQISDADGAPGAVDGLLFMGSTSAVNLARIRTLTAATVSYFTHIDESKIAPEVETMLKKTIAAEPTKEEASNPDWWFKNKPAVQHRWGHVLMVMFATPKIMDIVRVRVDGSSCK